MKRASKVILFLSMGCCLMGAGGIAAPNIRDSFLNRIVPLNSREEPLPPLTPIAPAETSQFRYKITDLSIIEGLQSFQPLSLNNKGDILGFTEDREPYVVQDRTDRPPQTRYRTIRTRYVLYQDSHPVVIKEYKSLPTFRPIAMNDRRQILGYSINLNEGPRNERILNLSGKHHFPRPSLNGFGPQVHDNRLMLWENGTFHDMNIPEALTRAGISSHLLGFLETAMLSFNNQGQLLIGFHNVYLWDNGSLKKISGSVSNGERLYLNDKGTMVRRADQYRPSPDGNNIYPLTAIYFKNETSPHVIDPGYYSSAVDLNNNNELLVGKMFLSSPETSRMRFSISSGGPLHTLFTVNGRTPAHLNDKGFVLAWRQQGSEGDWRHILSGGTAQNLGSIPVLWDGQRLFDLATLIPSGWELTGIIGMNDKNQILSLARKDGKIRPILLTPDLAGKQ